MRKKAVQCSERREDERGDCKLRLDVRDKELYKMIDGIIDGDFDGPQRLVLTGESGIGKTRLAKLFADYAVRMGSCYLTICLHLNNKFEDQISLYENIAFQIGAYDRDEKEMEKNPEDLLTHLKEKIIVELNLKYSYLEEKFKKYAVQVPVLYLLLILDDAGNKTSEDKVMKDFGLENFLKLNLPGNNVPLKVLITRRRGDENTTNLDDDIIEPLQYEFQTTDESATFLDSIDKEYLTDLFCYVIEDKTWDLLKSLQEDWKIEQPLASLVMQKSMSLPVAIVVLAKSLNSITYQDTFNCLTSKQEKILKEALSPCDCEPSSYSVSGYNPILQLAYQLLETDGTLNNAIVDCFWHSLEFLMHCGPTLYNELITQWILEGYFDPVRSVKKAYMDGYDILLELINRGILMTQGDMIVPAISMNSLIDLRRGGILDKSRLRFSRVYCGDKNKGLGKITQLDDMIKTVQRKKKDGICTILVSGNRLRREIPDKFFEQKVGLEVLVLFEPTLDCLTEHLRDLTKLRVLVIRDCDLLLSIEELRSLQGLNVLEVSGASSMETISDDFFASMSQLETLNLSGLRIKHSPSSISQLKHLHTLILRDCPILEYLPDIQELVKLEVVDVRGAHNLKTCFGKISDTRINQSFYHLWKLQLVDFSESKIKRLPTFYDPLTPENLHSMSRLLLQNCSDLIKLPNLKPLSGLQILDLSGATSLVDIAAVCFEQKEELKILNLSGTRLTKLPSTISELSNLSQLLLGDSSNLEAIPNIEGLTSLEVFDVSGCTKLHTIEGSFKYMFYLHKINLSGTMIETLPELPEKSNIGCSKLILLADSRSLERDTWGQIKEDITNGMPESLSSSDTVDGIQEISRKEHGRVRKKQLSEPWAFDCHIYRNVYMKTIPFVDIKSYLEILEIQGSNGVDQEKKNLAKAEFVTFVDNSSASLSSIFNDLKSVKGCWLNMCEDIEILFSGVDEERLEILETLLITNLRRLESISSSSSFKNLKKLSLDCCPSIVMLFPASAPPISLEVLKIMFCEKLEKVFEEEVELPNLHTLCLFELPVLSVIGAAKLPNLERYKKEKCPQLKISLENLKEGMAQMNEILCDSE